MRKFGKWILVLFLACPLLAFADIQAFLGGAGGVSAVSGGEYQFIAPIGTLVTNTNNVINTYSVPSGAVVFTTSGTGTVQGSSVLFPGGTFDVFADFTGNPPSTTHPLVSGNITGAVVALGPSGNSTLPIAIGLLAAIAPGDATFFNNLAAINLTQFNPSLKGAIVNLSLDAPITGGALGTNVFSAVVFSPEPAALLLVISAVVPLGLLRRRLFR